MKQSWDHWANTTIWWIQQHSAMRDPGIDRQTMCELKRPNMQLIDFYYCLFFILMRTKVLEVSRASAVSYNRLQEVGCNQTEIWSNISHGKTDSTYRSDWLRELGSNVFIQHFLTRDYSEIVITNWILLAFEETHFIIQILLTFTFFIQIYKSINSNLSLFILMTVVDASY